MIPLHLLQFALNKREDSGGTGEEGGTGSTWGPEEAVCDPGVEEEGYATDDTAAGEPGCDCVSRFRIDEANKAYQTFSNHTRFRETADTVTEEANLPHASAPRDRESDLQLPHFRLNSDAFSAPGGEEHGGVSGRSG